LFYFCEILIRGLESEHGSDSQAVRGQIEG